ncbi:hypothetical protein [Microbacterium sp. T32]|uniref:hypothetical protein n=1 Tax=Microbacterium sp. T32 TaxID=1776083 RepID=UPI0007ABABA2|nr:hypothetical protein [Microbacterium sp. T32]KZE41381.1 hypothetical protein AVW09_01995 [Microbacterium sp. T32]
MTDTRTVFHDGFWLDEASLMPEHVGQLVMIDHYAKRLHGPKDATRLDMNTHVGTLAGFAEARGTADYGPTDLGSQRNESGIYTHTEYPDISVHSDKFEVTVFLTDGRTFTIKEADPAYVRVFRREVTA